MNPIDDSALGQDRLTRIKKIKQIQQERTPDGKYFTFTSKNEQIPLNVYNIDISLPIYRLKNTRTQFQQESFLALNLDKDENFFLQGNESRDALRVQHELLLNEATDLEESNHYEIFKKMPYDQSQPMIINSKGILINGNTRMSAIRQLYNDDKGNFLHFSTIPMAILPEEITSEQEDYIERKLQQDRDIKIPYKWISIALKVRKRMIDDNEGIQDILNSGGFDGVKKTSINHPLSLLAALDMCDRYLKMIDKRDYKILVSEHYSMWYWSKYFKKWDNDKKMKKHIAILDMYVKDMIRNNEKSGGKAYSQIEDSAKELEKCTEEEIDLIYKELFKVDIEPSKPIEPDTDESKDDSDPFSGLGDDDEDDEHVTIINPEEEDEKGTKKKFDKIKKLKKDERERSKNRKQIFEDIQSSIERMDIFINKLKDNSNSFDKIKETLNIIPVLEDKIKVLKKYLERNNDS